MSITLNGDTGILVPANAEIEVGTNNGISSPATNKIAINTDGTQRLIVDDNGNVGVGTGTPAMALDVSGQVRASSGILFGTDTAAVNTLDDYEEGTWTPTVVAAANCSSVTFDQAKYTKIGRLVTLVAKGSLTVTTGSGVRTVFTFTGPFLQDENSTCVGGGGFIEQSVSPFETYAPAIGDASGIDRTRFALVFMSTFSGGADFAFSCSYFT